MGCEHDFAEREASVATEGLCPLCMVAELTRLRAVAEAAELFMNHEHEQRGMAVAISVLRAALAAWRAAK